MMAETPEFLIDGAWCSVSASENGSEIFYLTKTKTTDGCVSNNNRQSLIRTDGSATATYDLGPGVPGLANDYVLIDSVTESGSSVYYVDGHIDAGTALHWAAADGSSNRVLAPNRRSFSTPVTINNRVVVIASESRTLPGSKNTIAPTWELLAFDGPNAQVLLEGIPDRVTNLVQLGDIVMFGVGCELWKSDGTPDGTELVRSFEPQPESARFTVYDIVLNGQILFAIGDGLWSSDGTTAGTVSIPGSTPGSALKFQDRVYLASWGDSSKVQVTDGRTVTDLFEVEVTNSHVSMHDIGSELYFQANGQLWTTDGTAEGTFLVYEYAADDFSCCWLRATNRYIYITQTNTRSGAGSYITRVTRMDRETFAASLVFEESSIATRLGPDFIAYRKSGKETKILRDEWDSPRDLQDEIGVGTDYVWLAHYYFDCLISMDLS